MCADHWAGEAAERGWDSHVQRPIPHTDQVDCIAVLVRKRARRALIDSLAADPWQATREGKARSKPLNEVI
eukprot:209156-Pyramimonas_sp.AAC.1